MEEHKLAVFGREGWDEFKAGTNPVDRVGINTIADEANRLSMKSPASLFDHEGGSHQLKINKADDSKTASLLFQSNYQGRAEMGTMWGRDFRIKTSADGQSMAGRHDRRQRDGCCPLSRRDRPCCDWQEAIRSDFPAFGGHGNHLSAGWQPDAGTRREARRRLPRIS